MLLGYNTNGMAHHDLLDAVRVLAEIGYRSVAINIDHGALSPKSSDWNSQLAELRKLLQEFGLRSVIETGARYLLDPWRKHEPTLVSAYPAARARRVEFYRHAIHCAAELQSDCVSLWSGVIRDGVSPEEAGKRLVEGLQIVTEAAATAGVTIGLEPEPDMLVSTLANFEELLRQCTASNLRLTLDVGHLHCQQELPLADQIHRYGARLVNVHLEDMRAGVHEHLQFGEGEIDFPPVLQALADEQYRGGIHVELSRHSHQGPQAARLAYEFLMPLLEKISGGKGRAEE
jgi:sugar phosphate isomerase/epimerase